MYTIEKKDFGYKLVFGDFIKADEMKKWVEESRKALAAAPKEFGVFVDMRTLRPLPSESQVFMEEGQKLYKKKGMVRSVVILDSKVITLQFKRIAKETGIYEWERYVDASGNPNWEKIGLAWIKDGKDPDK
jgi:hypothetical protein